MRHDEQERDGLQTDDRLLDAIEALSEGRVWDEESDAYSFWADGAVNDKTQTDIIIWLDKNRAGWRDEAPLPWGAGELEII